MVHEYRTLVVHGDAKLSRDIADRLRQAFPEMLVVTSDDPSTFGYDFDVFVIDCRARSIDELELLRSEAPDSLFLGFVDGLDRDTLKQLVNLGMRGLFDSDSARDHEELAGRVRAFVTAQTESPEAVGVLGVMRSMADLVRQWNRRLDRLAVN